MRKQRKQTNKTNKHSIRLLHLVHDEKIECVGHIARADGDEEEIVSLNFKRDYFCFGSANSFF